MRIYAKIPFSKITQQNTLLTPPTPGIYMITSQLDGAHYVGGTINCYDRWQWHYNAIKRQKHKYTKEFFASLKMNKLSFFLLEKCSLKNLWKREQFWANKFPNRVNSSRFTTSVGGTIPSKETRQILSKASSGRVHSTKTCKKISLGLMGNKNNLGHIHSTETRKKIGLAHKGKIVSTQTRTKISQAKIGKPLGSPSKETRSKISKALKGIKRSIQTRLKLSLAAKNRKATPETCKKLSLAAKAYWKRKHGLN
jgi:group I intron endonuclease